MNYARSGSGVRGQFNHLCDWAKKVLRYRALGGPSVDSVLTMVRAELTDDVTPASFRAGILTLFMAYDF